LSEAAGVDAHRKRLRRDLEVQRAAIASLDLVEAGGAVGDDGA